MNKFQQLLNTQNDDLSTIDNADLGVAGQAMGLPIDPTSIPLQPGLTNDELQSQMSQSVPVQTPVNAITAPTNAPAPVSMPKGRPAPHQMPDQFDNSAAHDAIDAFAARNPAGAEAPEAPTSQLDRFQQIQNELKLLREQEAKQLADDEDTKFKQTLVAGLTEGLGKYMTGGIQKNVKAPIQYTGTTAKDIMSLVGRTPSKGTAAQREELLKEYGMLKKQDITPYQKAYLKLQEGDQEIRRSENRRKADKDSGENKITKGQEAVDRDFAKRYNEWTSVGAPKVQKNLAILTEAADKLEGMSDKDNNLSGRVQGRLPDVLQPQAAITMRDDIQSTALESLRQTLGPQFTENEGKRIMEKAYNPTLSPAENAKKLRRVITELEAQQSENNAKSEHFEGANSSLQGYKSGQAQSAKSDPKIADYAKQHGLDYSKAASILKARGYNGN